MEEDKMGDWKPVATEHWEPAQQTQAGAKRFQAHVSLSRSVPAEWHALFRKEFGTTTAADLVEAGGDHLVLIVDASLIKDVKTRVGEAIERANTSYSELLQREEAETRRVADKFASDKAYRENLERELNDE
jgi:hypothetical protein